MPDKLLLFQPMMPAEQMKAIEPTLFLSVAEAANHLRISTLHLRKLIWKKQGPPTTHIGRCIRIERNEFLAWASKRTKGKRNA